MAYKTEIEWLRARWLQEHGCARYPDNAFARFVAPDLTAEEIRDCEFENLDSLVEFVEHAEEGVYMILQRDQGLMLDEDGDWTADRDDAVRYAPGEFPRTIESLQGLYTLTAEGEIYGVPSEYRPPEEYRKEHDEAYPRDTKDYREPAEWLLDEYGDSLYVVREVREVYGEIEPARYT